MVKDTLRNYHGLAAFLAVLLGGYLLSQMTVQTEVTTCKLKTILRLGGSYGMALCLSEKHGLVEAKFKEHRGEFKTDDLLELHIRSSAMGTTYEVFSPSI